MEFIDFLIEESFISIVLIILIALFISNIIADKYKKYIDVSTNKAVDLMGDGVIILDVREAKELSSGYIKDSKHIPMANVKNKLNELDKNKAILVYCRSGKRSSHICSTLTRNEFTAVYNLEGGFNAWQKNDLPFLTK